MAACVATRRSLLRASSHGGIPVSIHQQVSQRLQRNEANRELISGLLHCFAPNWVLRVSITDLRHTAIGELLLLCLRGIRHRLTCRLITWRRARYSASGIPRGRAQQLSAESVARAAPTSAGAAGSAATADTTPSTSGRTPQQTLSHEQAGHRLRRPWRTWAAALIDP
jgi:hypothetical protein